MSEWPRWSPWWNVFPGSRDLAGTAFHGVGAEALVCRSHGVGGETLVCSAHGVGGEALVCSSHGAVGEALLRRIIRRTRRGRSERRVRGDPSPGVEDPNPGRPGPGAGGDAVQGERIRRFGSGTG